MTKDYRTQVTAIGGRTGSVASSDRRLRLNLSRPEALGGSGGDGTNPEQLFAAAYAACFLSAIQAAAEREGVHLAPDANVTAKIDVVSSEGGTARASKLDVGLSVGMAQQADGADGPTNLEVALSIDLPDLDDDIARRLLERAHATCLYSRALKGEVDVRTDLL